MTKFHVRWEGQSLATTVTIVHSIYKLWMQYCTLCLCQNSSTANGHSFIGSFPMKNCDLQYFSGEQSWFSIVFPLNIVIFHSFPMKTGDFPWFLVCLPGWVSPHIKDVPTSHAAPRCCGSGWWADSASPWRAWGTGGWNCLGSVGYPWGKKVGKRRRKPWSKHVKVCKYHVILDVSRNVGFSGFFQWEIWRILMYGGVLVPYFRPYFVGRFLLGPLLLFFPTSVLPSEI